MKQVQKGFTLMEMIGVIAVIAILASMATPMIFEAIRNARVSSAAADINAVRTAVASYYSDTGSFPVHTSQNTNGNGRLLMKNSSPPVAGWDGPYIEKELSNPFADNNVGVLTGSTSRHSFDLDGDGNPDTTSAVLLYYDGISNTDARKLSELFDGDGSVTTGDGAWDVAGRVKLYDADTVIFFISKD